MRNKPKPLPSRDVILKVFRFNAETGEFIRRSTGKKCGTVRRSGHVFVSIYGEHFGAHRLAYFLYTGEDPGDMFVDHIDHDPGNNRRDNLRLATLQQNTCHMSGVRGVRWRARDSVWYAQISVGGKGIYLGSFKTKDEAAAAANRARKEWFGEFAGRAGEAPQAQ